MNDSNDEISAIESKIKDLDLDYMRGLVSEEDYNRQIADLRTQLESAGGSVQGIPW